MAPEAEIKNLFTAIDARLAPMSAAERIKFLNLQMSAWAARERALLAWATGCGPHPFGTSKNTPDAFQIASIIADLSARIGELRDTAAAA